MDAVGFMHARNVCHLDLSAENVLLAERPPRRPPLRLHMKIVDFGLARVCAPGTILPGRTDYGGKVGYQVRCVLAASGSVAAVAFACSGPARAAAESGDVLGQGLQPSQR